MISLICSVLECLDVFRCGCHSFHRIFGSIFLSTRGFWQASSHDRKASVGLFSQNTRVCWSLLLTTHHKSMSAPRRRHGGRALPSSHTAPLYLSRHTHILTLQWALYAGCSVEYHHCFEFQCSARHAPHAHAVFYTHERTRTNKFTVVEHSYHKSIGGGCWRSWRRASRLGQPLSLLIC